MDGDALQTIINALLSAGGVGGAALLFGIWDRRRQSRNELLAGSNLERKELSDNWKEYIAKIEAESERWQQRLRDTEKALDCSRKERDYVWGAFRKFETLAFALRHEAVSRIYELHFQIFKGSEPLKPLPELPAGHTLYTLEKDKDNA